MQWGFQTLAGIDTNGPGFKKIIIHPNLPSTASNPDGKPLDWVRASYEHPRGKIASAWKREGGKLLLDVTIPANTTAAVYLPSDDFVAEKAGVISSKLRDGRAILEMMSGHYRFVVTPK